MFRGRAEQSLKASPQVGSLADVRLSLRVVSAKEKNSRRGGDEREVFSIAIGDEFEATGKHKVILVWIRSGRAIRTIEPWQRVCSPRPVETIPI